MKILFAGMPVTMLKGSELISMSTAPNTAVYLLSAILREEYDVTILDQFVIQKEAKDIGLEGVFEKYLADKDVLCLSSNTINWPLTLKAVKIARKVKGNSIKIVVGGLHPTFYYKHIIDTVDVDYVLRGEGEETLPQLIHAIEVNEGFEKIEGLIQKGVEPTEINLKLPIIDDETFKNLPLPAFDELPVNVYTMMPIETSRGCKFACKFCSVPHKNNWRMFDADAVISRNTEIIKRYQHLFTSKTIMITDDCFTTNLKRAAKIMNSLYSIDDENMFVVETRATDWLNADKEEAIKIFSNKQIRRLQFGVEAGYNSGLKKISKGLTIEKLEETIKLLEENNMIDKALFSFIIGFPWENIDDCITTIDYAASIVKRYHMGIVNLNWLMLYPSSLWNDRKKYGINVDEDIFDDESYEADKYFSITHPNFSLSSKQYIQSIINKYEDAGIYVRNF